MCNDETSRAESSSDEHRSVCDRERCELRKELSELVEKYDGDRRKQCDKESESDPYKEFAQIISQRILQTHTYRNPGNTGAAGFIHTIFISGLTYIEMQQLLRLQEAIRINEASTH